MSRPDPFAPSESETASARATVLRLADGYALLPERFLTRLEAAPAAAPRLIAFNAPLAADLGLGLDPQDHAGLAAVFSGNRMPHGSRPAALAYAGHQFGHFVPQLGDGRALLLGDALDRHGARRELQLKGSGRTPYSRGGDGRAALGPVLREFLVSEAMHALGVPSTRALAAVATGEAVWRDGALPGAILTRVAASHVRVGTFEYFAARGDVEALRSLADWVIERHYPQLRGAPSAHAELLAAVLERQAALIARWMHVGFIHGVMNTDNMAVSGETIDFGPCAFLDGYAAATVFSSIDRRGRYAFANQPAAGQWNLARFAEALLPLLDERPERAVAVAEEIVARFPARFEAHWLEGMRAKLGLSTRRPEDARLARRLLELMEADGADYTLTFRRLAEAAGEAQAPEQLKSSFAGRAAFEDWWASWRARAAEEADTAFERRARMRLANPWLVPRNHRIEQAIRAATQDGDFGPFEALRRALERPFEESPGALSYADAPRDEERVLATFCGT